MPTAPTAYVILLRREIPALVDDAPPAWLPLVPLGQSVGRDGRRFRLTDPAAAIELFRTGPADIPVDWEHATHVRGPKGLDAPAAGWVVALEARADGIWGRAEWTEAGARDVRSRAYRYYSPAYYLDPATGEVSGIASVGLTNQPNLALPALNRDGATEDAPMPIAEAIASALALPKEADTDAVVAAIEKLKADAKTALNRAQTPDLSLYVPRADHDAALNRATEAETALRKTQEAATDAEIENLIESGLSAARITPATVDYHRAQAKTEGGIERLRTYLDAAPAVVTSESRNAKPPPDKPELNSQQAVRKVLAHYEAQTEDEQFAEIEAAHEHENTIMMAVPANLAAEVRALIASKQSH